MAITITSLQGADGLTGSRPIINDNFRIVEDEINAIESFIDPDAGTIDGLNSLETLELFVGPAGNYNLELNASALTINTAVNFTSPTGLFKIDGLVAQNSFALLDEAAFTGTAVVTPLSGFANYVVKHTSTSDFVIQLDEANPGQEISFFLEQVGSGAAIVSNRYCSISIRRNKFKDSIR